ncbi:Trimethyllysine dioxygenase [Pluteus cervinus]|uniref:Trimethyllysine dioxygenase n=1 Tax=Pluteus cervinus TaxID=181527 RepID=A0ACD3B508_9AGAR|nr:Trimethyllysine dioxygenase [Pluteus cervinus]
MLQASARTALCASRRTLASLPHKVYKVPGDDLPVISSDESQVAIGWDPRTWSRFHHIWLRDHCRCPLCFHPTTKQRLLNTFEVPRDIKPVSVESKLDGLTVTWPSSQPHTSFYPWSWLRRNSYDPVHKQEQNRDHEQILWGSKIAQSPPTIAYKEVMHDDLGLYKWLSNIHRFGFSFVTGVPPTPEKTQELAERIGFIRETQYGGFWDFTSDLAKGDTAYTTLALGAHTDTTYYTDPCGLQLFHLLSHTGGAGGASLLVDGFYVASILKELNPDAYKLLSTIPVPAHAAGEPSALYQPSPVHGYPVLSHEARTGLLSQVRWNNDDRSVMSHLDPHEVEAWYDAIRAWHQCLTSPDSEYWVQLQAGTAVVIDNHRVLHGRSSFTGARRMCGAYVGVDEFRSKLATLGDKYSPDDVLLATNNLSDAVHNDRNIWNAAL